MHIIISLLSSVYHHHCHHHYYCYYNHHYHHHHHGFHHYYHYWFCTFILILISFTCHFIAIIIWHIHFVIQCLSIVLFMVCFESDQKVKCHIRWNLVGQNSLKAMYWLWLLVGMVMCRVCIAWCKSQRLWNWYQGPLLLAWFNRDLDMHKKSHPWLYVW